jgi:hypothetical protein
LARPHAGNDNHRDAEHDEGEARPISEGFTARREVPLRDLGCNVSQE